MFPIDSFRETLGRFVQIATALQMPYHLTGGAVSSAYGEPRLTQDIDIVVCPKVAKQKSDHLIQLLRSFSARGIAGGCSAFKIDLDRQRKPSKSTRFATHVSKLLCSGTTVNSNTIRKYEPPTVAGTNFT